MKWNEFVREGQDRVLPTIVEIYEKKYPAYSSQNHPICYTSFHDLAVIFTLCTTFLHKKKKKSLHSIRYKEISSIEVMVVKVPTVYLHLLGTSLHLQLVIRLKNKEIIHLENDDISCLPTLLKLLKKKKIHVKDKMNIQSHLHKHRTMEAFYTYIDKNFSTVSENKEEEMPK